MKNFLSKYWKRILILIGSIFIIINIMGKCTAPHSLVQEYAKYGPSIESTHGKIDVDINTSEIVTKVEENSPFSEDIVKIVLILTGLLIGVTVLSDIANKKPAKKK